MRTWRARGTTSTASGRLRPPSGLIAAFTIAEVTAIDATPARAARLPRPPRPTTSSAVTASESWERSAARVSRLIARSIAGVGVAAIAA
jgi:hypothetical protein